MRVGSVTGHWPVLFVLLGTWIFPDAHTARGESPGDTKADQELAARLAALGDVAGITRPHREATLASIQPARVTQLAVSEGQLVAQGTLLVVLDDDVQRVRTEKAEADAKSFIDIKLSVVKMVQTSRDLERLRKLSGDDNASNRELLDAQAIADTARLKYEEALFEHEQAVRDHEFQRLLLERLRVRAPFTGYITETFKQPGETVQEAEAILRIVALNPLDVSVDCPLSAARAIQVGSRVTVRPADTRWEPRTAEVVFASPVIDPASQTFKVKLRVDNRDGGWISGLKVWVDFAASPPAQQARFVRPVSDGPVVNESRTVSKHE